MANKGYISVELPSSVPGIGYTLKHRNAVEELIKYYCKKAIGKKMEMVRYSLSRIML